MWVDIIQESGEEPLFEESFGETQLCLIPKTEEIPRPDQFQPISITNSDYRIITRYWALWFMDNAGGYISEFQNVMFPGRCIDAAVEKIHDSFVEAILEGEETLLLQTDFCKAYDFINRQALMIILKELGAPRQIQNLARKILEPAQVWLPNIGKKGHMGKPECILGQTGVRQGCPISPLLFIIVFDLLL